MATANAELSVSLQTTSKEYRDWLNEWIALRVSLENAALYKQLLPDQSVTEKTITNKWRDSEARIIEYRNEQYLLRYTYKYERYGFAILELFVPVPIPQTWWDKLLFRQRTDLILIWQDGQWLVRGKHERGTIARLKAALELIVAEGIRIVTRNGEMVRERERERLAAHHEKYQAIVAKTIEKQ